MQISRLSLVSCGLHTAWASITSAIFALMLTQAVQAATVSFYVENASSCPNQSSCEVTLLIIPANRAFTVSNASCLLQHGSQTVEILWTQLLVASATGQILVRDSVVPVLTGKATLGSYFSFNQQTTLVLSAGQRLRISIATDAISSFYIQCKIAGDWRVV